MKGKLRHVGIAVRDLKKSLAFYEKLGFGGEAKNWSAEWVEEGRTYILKLDNQIELIDGPWMNHFAITVDSLEGIELPTKPLFKKETDKVKVCYIMDPDGNVLELVEEKK